MCDAGGAVVRTSTQELADFSAPAVSSSAASYDQPLPGGIAASAGGGVPSEVPEGRALAASSLESKPAQQKQKMAEIFSMLLNTD